MAYNSCITNVGQFSNMKGFCGTDGNGNSGQNFCANNAQLSLNTGEWANWGPWHPPPAPMAQCSRGTHEGSCQRVKFTGNPTLCCMNDLLCVNPNCTPGRNDALCNNPPQCYSDAQHYNTCAYEFRATNSDTCRTLISPYCSGNTADDIANPESTVWMDRWTNPSPPQQTCPFAIYRNMFNVPRSGALVCENFPPLPTIKNVCNFNANNNSSTYPVESRGYFWAQQLISDAIERYTSQGFVIGALPGDVGYNPWQDMLYDTICCPYPGLCQPALTQVCALATTQRLALNPSLNKWCGCHLPQGEYQDYSVKYNVPPECTPMCNRASAVPLTGLDGLPIQCQQNICIIDNVTLNLINSEIGGGVNFNNLCGSCANTFCSCIISDTTIDITNSIIGGNVIPITQICGQLTCSKTNPGNTGPADITVPCDAPSTYNPYAEYQAEIKAAQNAARKTSWLITLIVIGVSLLLIFLIILIIHPNYRLLQDLLASHNNEIPTTTPMPTI